MGLRVDLGVGVEDDSGETGGWRPDGRQPGGEGGGGWWGCAHIWHEANLAVWPCYRRLDNNVLCMKQIWQYGPVIEDSTTTFFSYIPRYVNHFLCTFFTLCLPCSASWDIWHHHERSRW
jgi:hypothetical protein